MNQNGNAIVLILVTIALFAALGYAFSNSSRTSTSFISDEQAKTYANQIIAYGNDMQQAIKRLQIRGCSDEQISFENSVVTGYTNPNSPPDKSCHVFNLAGGGLTWQTQNPQTIDRTIDFMQNYSMNATNSFISLGAFSVDLAFFANVTEDICRHINNSLNIVPAFPPNTDVDSFSIHPTFKFNGDYVGGATINAYSDTKKACFHGKHAGVAPHGYYYYHVFIVK